MVAVAWPWDGTVSPGTGRYPVGATVTFTATPDAEWGFAGWYVDGQFVGFGNTLQLPITHERTIEARFAYPHAFCDVGPDTPGGEAIAGLALRDIVKGQDGCFRPGDPVLRAQAAVLATRALSFPPTTEPAPFPDRCDPQNRTNCADPELWGAVGTLAAASIVHGYSDRPEQPTCTSAGTRSPCFLPRDPILRVQAISIITRAFVARGLWQQETTDDPALYPNVPTDSGHRLDLATYVRNVGPVPDLPTGGDFTGYDQPATRAFFARALWQAYSAAFSTNRVAP